MFFRQPSSQLLLRIRASFILEFWILFRL